MTHQASKNWGWFGIALLATLGTHHTAAAEPSADRLELEKRSRESGIGQDELQLMRRLPGRGANATLGALLERFSRGAAAGYAAPFQLTGPFERSEDRDGHARIRGADGWSVDIKGDGTSFRIVNRKHLEDAGKVVPDRRLALRDLERLGRDFIARELDGLVKLGDDEELVLLKSEYEVEEDGDKRATLRQEVVANTVIFGRTIRGVHVVGAGSKIAIEFANDGIPVAAFVDWPQYEKGARAQRMLGQDALMERISSCATMGLKADDVRIERFECGYVDLGARRKARDPEASMQAGCFVHYSGRKAAGDGNLTAASVDVVPAAVVVEPDRGWPAALEIARNGDRCATTELSGAVIPGVGRVPARGARSSD